MRVGVFNMENLFERATALAPDDWATNRPLLDAHSRLVKILQRKTYSPTAQVDILTLLATLGLLDSDESPLFRLRQNRGRLLRRSAQNGVQIIARGRGDWIGWVEPKRTTATELAMRHTAAVVHDLDLDVLGVVEAEHRTALRRFNADLLAPLGGRVFGHVMLIDGNDDRGIDVGLMTRGDLPITRIVSHVDDADLAGPVFGRDCPEYTVALPGGGSLLVMVNHFKSKGYGGAESAVKRRRQAERVRQIYDQRRAEGIELIIVMGDLNDTPDSTPLAPLLATRRTAQFPRSDLRDISTHRRYDGLGRPGTYGTASAGNKIDYLLCSPAVFSAVRSCGVFRKGVWSASRRWEMYPTLTREQDAASDHAALWAELDL